MSIFLQIGGVAGKAADDRHREWLNIISLSWSIQRRITAHTATTNDRESSNAELGALEIVRFADQATPKLFVEACCGTGKTLVIHLTKTGTGGGAETYMAYTLKNALISHYRTETAAGDITPPLELLRISFTAIELRYTPYDQDGKAMAPLVVGFDTATNQKQ